MRYRNYWFAIFLSTLSLQARSIENASPLTWNGFAKVEDINNVHGGIKRGSVLDGALQIKGMYDTEVAKLWSGGQFTFGLFGFAQSHNQALYTGAIQSPSDLSANNNEVRPYLSYQQKFNPITTARAGIIDLNDYFNVTETASGFLNNSFGISPILTVNSPTATSPYPGCGAMIELDGDHFGGQLGLFQGNPQHLDTVFHNGYMLIGEINAHILSSTAKDSPELILKAGTWHYEQSNAQIGNTNNGLYIIAEGTWQNEDSQHRGVFLQFGADPKKVNTVPYSFGGGYTANAIFDYRPKDVLSLGFTRVWVQGASQETVFEITYGIEIIDKLTLNPDLQYVVKPAGHYRNALVGIVRLSYAI